MAFRFYTNAVSQASKAFATGTFIVGLMLMGFATIIWALPEIFAFLAAAVFFVAGIGCLITAAKAFIASKKLANTNSGDSQDYRKNVRIRIDERDEG